jgi:plastocyanin
MRVQRPATLTATLWMLLALAAGSSAGAHDITGTVAMVGADGKALTGEQLTSVVVSFEPKTRVTPKLPASPFVMATKGKEFEPRVLAVPRGATVAFPNQDPILHNVFSLSPGNRFDLGLYRKGPGKSMAFKEPGLVRVYCNVHQSMVAYILVLDTPYFASPDAQGRFTVSGPVPGPGTLTVWYERSEPFTQTLTVPSAPVVAKLVVNKPRVPAHVNKLGKAYSRGPEY